MKLLAQLLNLLLLLLEGGLRAAMASRKACISAAVIGTAFAFFGFDVSLVCATTRAVAKRIVAGTIRGHFVFAAVKQLSFFVLISNTLWIQLFT